MEYIRPTIEDILKGSDSLFILRVFEQRTRSLTSYGRDKWFDYYDRRANKDICFLLDMGVEDRDGEVAGIRTVILTVPYKFHMYRMYLPSLSLVIDLRVSMSGKYASIAAVDIGNVDKSYDLFGVGMKPANKMFKLNKETIEKVLKEFSREEWFPK